MFSQNPGKTSLGLLILLVILLAVADYILQWPRSDTLSAQQLLIAVLLVPVAAYGFLTTAAAFQKTQLKPKLDLEWRLESGTLSGTLSLINNTRIGGTGHRGTIALKNAGDVIALVLQDLPWVPLDVGVAQRAEMVQNRTVTRQ